MAEQKVYPSTRYHKTKDSVIVQNEEEDRALGPGWADTPAAFADEDDHDPHAKAVESRPTGILNKFQKGKE